MTVGTGAVGQCVSIVSRFAVLMLRPLDRRDPVYVRRIVVLLSGFSFYAAQKPFMLRDLRLVKCSRLNHMQCYNAVPPFQKSNSSALKPE